MFFTSDTHFGHKAIIRHCARPFDDVETMDRTMVDRWNAVVRPRDDVWHLGDFAQGFDAIAMEALFRRLNGRKRLVVGNHDGQIALGLGWFQPPTHMAFVKNYGTRFVLCHYGLRVWPGQRHGAVSLYGHSHGRLPGTSRSLDVGVDAWDFRPINVDDILARLATLPVAPEPEVDVVERD